MKTVSNNKITSPVLHPADYIVSNLGTRYIANGVTFP